MSWRAAILIQGKGSNNCLLVTEKQCCKKTVWINESVNTGLMSYFLCFGGWALRGWQLSYTREHSAELTGSWFLPAALLTHCLVTRPGTWRVWALDTGHLFHSTTWELSSCSGFGEVQLLPGVSGKQIDTRDTSWAILRSCRLIQTCLYRGWCPTQTWQMCPEGPWLAVASSTCWFQFVPVTEQHQGTKKPYSKPLLFFFTSPLCSFPLWCASPFLCSQGNSSTCTWTASLGLEAFFCCSYARRCRLQNPDGVS